MLSDDDLRRIELIVEKHTTISVQSYLIAWAAGVVLGYLFHK